MKSIILPALAAALAAPSLAAAQYKAERFDFDAHGRTYVGVLDIPAREPAKGLILMIHGHGRTNVVEGDDFKSHRERFMDDGWAVALYDRAGNGLSEGEYDHGQSVESSAVEVAAALDALRADGAPGAHNIGLWGVSRGGWIAPLAIEQDGGVDFWISISGPSQYETFDYMLERNLVLEGRSPEYAARLRRAFIDLQMIPRDPSATYDQYAEAVGPLFEDEWFAQIGGDMPTREDFEAAKRDAAADPDDLMRLDPEAGRFVHVEDFAQTLRALDMPVLAVLGDKDSQLNWRTTRDFYRETLGEDRQSDLTLVTLEDCNHSMRVVETGAAMEDLDQPGLGGRCPGYFEAMADFLEDQAD